MRRAAARAAGQAQAPQRRRELQRDDQRAATPAQKASEAKPRSRPARARTSDRQQQRDRPSHGCRCSLAQSRQLSARAPGFRRPGPARSPRRAWIAAMMSRGGGEADARPGRSRASSIGRKAAKVLGPGDGDDRDIARPGARAPARGAGNSGAERVDQAGVGQAVGKDRRRRRPQLRASASSRRVSSDQAAGAQHVGQARRPRGRGGRAHSPCPPATTTPLRAAAAHPRPGGGAGLHGQAAVSRRSVWSAPCRSP